MIKIVFLVAALAAAPLAAQADTLALWNFNSTVPDNSTSSGSTLPAVGSGTASLVGGVTSPGFNSGAGSSDPETSDDSGWQTTTYAAQGAGNKTRGVQFSVSTLGFENIVFSYDLRHSNTSSRYEAVQYTLNGSNWVDAATFDGNAGDTWFNLRTLDLSSVTGANDNTSFALRVLSTFAPSGTGYLASSSTGTYSANGTWRFDMVTVSATPVPEPETYALMLAGLAALGLLARRRA